MPGTRFRQCRCACRCRVTPRLCAEHSSSVLAQDFDDFEVLIGDETGAAEPAVVEAADPRVVYHRNPARLGFSKNHLALLDRAAGAT